MMSNSAISADERELLLSYGSRDRIARPAPVFAQELHANLVRRGLLEQLPVEVPGAVMRRFRITALGLDQFAGHWALPDLKLALEAAGHATQTQHVA